MWGSLGPFVFFNLLNFTSIIVGTRIWIKINVPTLLLKLNISQIFTLVSLIFILFRRFGLFAMPVILVTGFDTLPWVTFTHLILLYSFSLSLIVLFLFCLTFHFDWDGSIILWWNLTWKSVSDCRFLFIAQQLKEKILWKSNPCKKLRNKEGSVGSDSKKRLLNAKLRIRLQIR